jgi:2-oxoacid:acceptor oxidoreductase delta subunit (pyruvate/2-ketoisovalerate family)
VDRPLNTDCVREIRPRGIKQEAVVLDFERHDPPLSSSEVRSEASRCLGTISCEACDVCRLMCPDLAITRDRITGSIVIDLDFCKGCGICAAVCPKGAIEMVVEQVIEYKA